MNEVLRTPRKKQLCSWKGDKTKAKHGWVNESLNYIGAQLKGPINETSTGICNKIETANKGCLSRRHI